MATNKSSITLKKSIIYGLLLVLGSGIGAIVFERLIVPQFQTVPFLRDLAFFDSRAPITITQREEIHIDSGVNTQEIINRVRGALVSVYATGERLSPTKPVGVISGMVATNDGLILVPQGTVGRGDDVTVVLANSASYIGRVIFVDAISGIGFVKIPARDLTVLNETTARSKKPGEPLLLLSLEEGQEIRANNVELVTRAVSQPSLSQTHDFSAFETTLELDVAVAERVLGAVLVDKDGTLVGFVSRVNDAATLLRVEDVQMVIDNFLGHRGIEVIWPQPRLAYLVVGSVEAELVGLPKKSGIVVRQTYQTLEIGDFVYEAEGSAITVENSFQQIIFGKNRGEKIKLKLLRKGLEREVEISL